MAFTTRRRADIHFAETGSGPMVLYLHSGTGRGGDWRPIVDRLGAGWRT